MKTKVLLGLAAIGIASAMTARAYAGVSFDVRIGFPLPPIPGVVISTPAPCPPPIVVAPRPVCPPPVVVAPRPVCPPPVVVVRSPMPVCPQVVVVSHPVGHPRFIPPGHAKRYAYDRDDYRHPGRGHDRH